MWSDRYWAFFLGFVSLYPSSLEPHMDVPLCHIIIIIIFTDIRMSSPTVEPLRNSASDWLIGVFWPVENSSDGRISRWWEYSELVALDSTLIAVFFFCCSMCFPFWLQKNWLFCVRNMRSCVLFGRQEHRAALSTPPWPSEETWLICCLATSGKDTNYGRQTAIVRDPLVEVELRAAIQALSHGLHIWQ